MEFDKVKIEIMRKSKFLRLNNVTNLVLIAGFVVLSSCALPTKKTTFPHAKISNKTKFSSSKYGVKSSPRVTTSKKVKKGGGRYQVGKPYKIRGKWYYPKEQPGYNKTGMASWYGPNFHGRLTANGEVYDQNSLSAAHPTLPLPSYAKVTNLENGTSVIVRVNDRGPFSRKRIIDLSARASELLGYQKKGLARVRVRYVGKARMDGLDRKYLVASYRGPKGNRNIPKIAPGATMPGTMIASATPTTKITNQTGFAPASPGLIKPEFQASYALNNVGAVKIPIPSLRPTPSDIGMPMDLVKIGTKTYKDNYNVYSNHLKPLGFVAELKTEINYANRISQAFRIVDNYSK